METKNDDKTANEGTVCVALVRTQLALDRYSTFGQ